MKARRLLPWILLSIGSLAVLVSPAPARDAPEAKPLEKRLGVLCERLEAERTKNHIPGMALVVVKDDKVVLAKGFGMRDLENTLPVTPETLFAIGSTTKAFTVALLQMLADDGKLALDDPVRKYLPYFQIKDETANAKVTLRDLLCHRTGLTRMGLLWAAGKTTRREILEQVKEAELYKPFRQQFLYNNVMFLAAGEAAGAAAETSWEALLKERIFAPLGMRRATPSTAAMQKDPAASKGYQWMEDTETYKRLPMRALHAIAPAGAINANVLDMARWIRFLLAGGVVDGKRLLSKERLQECWTPQQEIGSGVSYGLGWMLREWKGRQVVEHGGNIDGFSAQVGLMPSEHLGYVLLMNVTASPLQAGSLEIVWESMLGDLARKSDTPETRPLTEADMQPYLGEYRLPRLDVTATVRVEDGRLGIDIPGQRFFLLKWPDAKGLWAFDFPAPISVEFETPVAGQAPSLTIRQAYRARLKRTSNAEAGDADAKSPGPGEAWSPEQMKPLAGSYDLAQPSQTWRIQVLEGELAVLLPGQPPHPMHWPDENGRWKIKVDPNQSIAFVRGEDGAVSAIEFERIVVMQAPRVDVRGGGDTKLKELFEKRLGSGALEPSTPRWHARGTVRFVHQGVKGPFEVWVDGPTRSASVMDFGKFGVIRKALDGERGWVDSDFGPFEEASGMVLEYMKLEHPVALFGDWRKVFERVAITETKMLDGEEVYVVRCTPHGAPAMTRYVSTKTGLVVRDDWYIIAHGTLTFPIRVTYSDYRKVGGMPLPFHQESQGVQTGKVVIELTSAEPVDEIPKAAFEPRRPR